jgi:hypothetical protein
MTLHLIKLAVGAESVADIRAFQNGRRGGGATVTHPTRNAPKRADELLAGGSLYWVVRGLVRVRQRLVGVELGTAGARCLLVLDPALVETVPRAQRPFQGWRYLRAEDAPADAPGAEGDAAQELPPALVAELAKLGLL